MRTSNALSYALRLSFGQAQSLSTPAASPDKIVGRSAAVLAAVGIALSSFSLKQLLNSRHAAKRSFSTN